MLEKRRTSDKGRLEEPHCGGECDPVPSGHTDAAGDDAHDGADLSLRNHPITLVDIDRLLEVSADVERAGPGTPIRAWRDDLTLVLEALSYARAILSADLVILRHAGVTGGEQAKRLLDDVPGVLGAGPEAEQSSHPAGGSAEPEPEPSRRARARAR